MFSCLKKNIDRGLHSGKIFTVCNQFLWAKILVTFRRGNVVSTLYPCMFSCAKSQIFFCFEKEKSALNRKKNVYALKGFVYNLKAIFPGIGKESAYTHYSLAATKLFFSSLTQRCLIVIHLCAAILWIVVNVLVFCASLCSVYWREQFGAGLEELVCVVDFLYMFLISMFYSFVFHIINHILAASSFCLCTSGWFFFFFLFRMDSAGIQSCIYLIKLHITLLFWTCRMGFHSFCLDESKDGSKSRNVFHWAVTSASTLKIGYVI